MWSKTWAGLISMPGVGPEMACRRYNMTVARKTDTKYGGSRREMRFRKNVKKYLGAYPAWNIAQGIINPDIAKNVEIPHLPSPDITRTDGSVTKPVTVQTK